MRTLKQHVDIVKQAMNTKYSVTKEAEILTATNVCAQTIAGTFPIGDLTKKTVITAGGNQYLPDNMAGIITVRDSSGNRLFERGSAASQEDEDMGRYYIENGYEESSSSALPFKSTGSISAGGSDLTCADLKTLSDTETISGLTLRLVNATYGEYFYVIDSINEDDTIKLKGVHPFEETDVEVTVVDASHRLIKFIDYSESEITSGEYTVYYWTYPNPLTQDSERIPFAYPDYLELMTIRRMPETKDRRPVSKNELEDAMGIAKKREPNQSMPARPVGQQGSPFKMTGSGVDVYTVRGE